MEKHTEYLLSDVLMGIDDDFQQVFSNGITWVSFLVTKPLSKEVALVDE